MKPFSKIHEIYWSESKHRIKLEKTTKTRNIDEKPKGLFSYFDQKNQRKLDLYKYVAIFANLFSCIWLHCIVFSRKLSSSLTSIKSQKIQLFSMPPLFLFSMILGFFLIWCPFFTRFLVTYNCKISLSVWKIGGDYLTLL